MGRGGGHRAHVTWCSLAGLTLTPASRRRGLDDLTAHGIEYFAVTDEARGPFINEKEFSIHTGSPLMPSLHMKLRRSAGASPTSPSA